MYVGLGQARWTKICFPSRGGGGCGVGAGCAEWAAGAGGSCAGGSDSAMGTLSDGDDGARATMVAEFAGEGTRRPWEMTR